MESASGQEKEIGWKELIANLSTLSKKLKSPCLVLHRKPKELKHRFIFVSSRDDLTYVPTFQNEVPRHVLFYYEHADQNSH